MCEKIVFENEITLTSTSFEGVPIGAMRETYVEELLGIANEGEDIVFMLSDNGTAKAIGVFREQYPDRVIEVGIAEPNQVGMAAGLGLSGKMVYAQFFGTFLAPEVLITTSVLPEKIGILNKGIDIPILYDNSKVFYRL